MAKPNGDRVVVEGHRHAGAEGQWISSVERGASRAPIKITKNHRESEADAFLRSPEGRAVVRKISSIADEETRANVAATVLGVVYGYEQSEPAQKSSNPTADRELRAAFGLGANAQGLRFFRK